MSTLRRVVLLALVAVLVSGCAIYDKRGNIDRVATREANNTIAVVAIIGAVIGAVLIAADDQCDECHGHHYVRCNSGPCRQCRHSGRRPCYSCS